MYLEHLVKTTNLHESTQSLQYKVNRLTRRQVAEKAHIAGAPPWGCDLLPPLNQVETNITTTTTFSKKASFVPFPPYVAPPRPLTDDVPRQSQSYKSRGQLAENLTLNDFYGRHGEDFRGEAKRNGQRSLRDSNHPFMCPYSYAPRNPDQWQVEPVRDHRSLASSTYHQGIGRGTTMKVTETPPNEYHPEEHDSLLEQFATTGTATATTRRMRMEEMDSGSGSGSGSAAYQGNFVGLSRGNNPGEARVDETLWKMYRKAPLAAIDQDFETRHLYDEYRAHKEERNCSGWQVNGPVGQGNAQLSQEKSSTLCGLPGGHEEERNGPEAIETATGTEKIMNKSGNLTQVSGFVFEGKQKRVTELI